MITRQEKGRRVRIRTRLATAIPGVSLRLRGSARYLSSHRTTRTERSVLRMAAARSVQRIAQEIVRPLFPGQDHDLGNRISLTLSSWRKSPLEGYPDLQVRAWVHVRLDRADHQRVERYHSDRRRRHGDLAFESDRLDHFTGTVLHSTSAARFWWAETHGISVEAQQVFDRLFLPLVRNGDGPRDKANKVASVIASAILGMESNHPTDFASLLRTVDVLLRKAGHTKEADQLTMDLHDENSGLETSGFPTFTGSPNGSIR